MRVRGNPRQEGLRGLRALENLRGLGPGIRVWADPRLGPWAQGLGSLGPLPRDMSEQYKTTQNEAKTAQKDANTMQKRPVNSSL